jgi:hypothetical protein
MNANFAKSVTGYLQIASNGLIYVQAQGAPVPTKEDLTLG